ncbi:hypothetical protein E2C01_022968 [Portunus trituberculatus]|uniref:Uncharacterized protein n=1 Tax=Portunus trituberculatus TaxID=210409 RepID=A0A5B7E6U0_PORTR|nr:hypothetical protein [Portunus trituberculatus]
MMLSTEGTCVEEMRDRSAERERKASSTMAPRVTPGSTLGSLLRRSRAHSTDSTPWIPCTPESCSPVGSKLESHQNTNLGKPGQRVPSCWGQRCSISWVRAAPNENSACTTRGVDGIEMYGTTGSGTPSWHSSPTQPNSCVKVKG